jgi:hypothetical protein
VLGVVVFALVGRCQLPGLRDSLLIAAGVVLAPPRSAY